MKNSLIILYHNAIKKLCSCGLLLLIILASGNNLLAQRSGVGVVNPGGEAGEWVSGNGKLYTLTGRVGIGTSTPFRKLHIWGPDHRYFRVTSQGGTQFSNAVAGVELERLLDNGTILNWDIVNQGTFKVRRNTTTLFILDEEEAQFGSQNELFTLNVWGKNVNNAGGGQVSSGALALRSGSSVLRLDGNQIESSNGLFLNWMSDDDIKMAQAGEVGIGPVSNAGAKLGVKSDGWQLNLMNDAKSWRIGVSADDWNVGAGKLVFSKTSASNDALMVLTEQGRVGIGMTTPNRTLDVNGSVRVSELEVNGKTTTQVLEITGGADLAESFDVAGERVLEPGTVVAIDPAHAGHLKVAAFAYDKSVAGIVSGAGNIKPGMVMGQDGSIASGEHPVALTGRVYAKVDASYGAIHPGDLLTTSDTPGHAMKASNPIQAQGAIIGKAMTALENGQGLVLVLVSLQ